jgi:hypothetical protein
MLDACQDRNLTIEILLVIIAKILFADHLHRNLQQARRLHLFRSTRIACTTDLFTSLLAFCQVYYRESTATSARFARVNAIPFALTVQVRRLENYSCKRLCANALRQCTQAATNRLHTTLQQPSHTKNNSRCRLATKDTTVGAVPQRTSLVFCVSRCVLSSPSSPFSRLCCLLCLSSASCRRDHTIARRRRCNGTFSFFSFFTSFDSLLSSTFADVTVVSLIMAKEIVRRARARTKNVRMTEELKVPQVSFNPTGWGPSALAKFQGTPQNGVDCSCCV